MSELITECKEIKFDYIDSPNYFYHLPISGFSYKIEAIGLPENVEFYLMTSLFKTNKSEKGILIMDGKVSLLFFPSEIESKKYSEQIIDLSKLTNTINDDIPNNNYYINTSKLDNIFIVFDHEKRVDKFTTSFPLQNIIIKNYGYNIINNGVIKYSY